VEVEFSRSFVQRFDVPDLVEESLNEVVFQAKFFVLFNLFLHNYTLCHRLFYACCLKLRLCLRGKYHAGSCMSHRWSVQLREPYWWSVCRSLILDPTQFTLVQNSLPLCLVITWSILALFKCFKGHLTEHHGKPVPLLLVFVAKLTRFMLHDSNLFRQLILHLLHLLCQLIVWSQSRFNAYLLLVNLLSVKHSWSF